MTNPILNMPSYGKPCITPKGIPLMEQSHKYAKPMSKLAMQRMKGLTAARVPGKVHIKHKKIKWA